MRIVLINSLFPPLGIGGSEMSVYFLAKGLNRLGHDVMVITENDTPQDVSEDDDGIQIHRIGSPQGYGPNILAQAKLTRDIQRKNTKSKSEFLEKAEAHVVAFKPQIIQTNVIGNLRKIWQFANKHKIPVIHTLRSYTMICSRRMLKGTEPCTRQCRDCALHGSRLQARDHSSTVDGIVGISNHILDVHRNAGWFVNVPNSAIIANSYERTDDAPIGDSADKPFDIGYIGRLHETKGIEVFLDSLAAVQKKTRKKIRVLIAGTGNPHYVGELQRKYMSEQCEFVGHINTGDFFDKVKVCVVPSLWYEPFGRVFIEAMHHGVPVIGSRRGGGAEVLDEKTGWLFDPSNPDELQAQISSALSLSGRRINEMQKECLDHSSNFTVEAIARHYETFYRDVYVSCKFNSENEVK